MTEFQLTTIVAGCVIEQDEKYLLVQEKKESAHGLWNLPSGRVDDGESFKQTAVREVFEETGYEVEIIKKLLIDHYEPARPVLHSYKAKIIGGGLNIPREHFLDARWFTFDEVMILWSRGKLRIDWVAKSIEKARG